MTDAQRSVLLFTIGGLIGIQIVSAGALASVPIIFACGVER